MVQYLTQALRHGKGWPLKTDASYDLSGARASVTGQTTIAVEAEAARDDRFTWALGKIWIGGKGLPPDIVERIVIASGFATRSC